jgi:GT2 family glycosyltransferase
LRQEFGGLKTIALEKNRGFAAANNAGAKVAERDWLILMNSDAELFTDTMPVIDDLLREHPQLDVLGGQLLNPDGSSQTSVLSDFHRIRHEPRELVEVSGIVGAFMVVRRALCEKLNGMDEGFFFYGEDLDFCERAINAGAVLRYSPRFRVIHHDSSSSEMADLRAIIEGWESRHYLWCKEMSEQEYRANVRRCASVFFRVVWYFSLALLTGFLLRAFTGRLSKYFHLLKWHLCGCPAGWGFRPAESKPF